MKCNNLSFWHTYCVSNRRGWGLFYRRNLRKGGRKKNGQEDFVVRYWDSASNTGRSDGKYHRSSRTIHAATDWLGYCRSLGTPKGGEIKPSKVEGFVSKKAESSWLCLFYSVKSQGVFIWAPPETWPSPIHSTRPSRHKPFRIPGKRTAVPPRHWSLRRVRSNRTRGFCPWRIYRTSPGHPSPGFPGPPP
jgi:hypothetical protein